MTATNPALPVVAAEKAIREALPVVAYLRATKDGKPVWDGDDCVCEDPVYPSDPDGSDADCISMAMVRLSDAEAHLAELRAANERLQSSLREAQTLADSEGSRAVKYLRVIRKVRSVADGYLEDVPPSSPLPRILAIVAFAGAAQRKDAS